MKKPMIMLLMCCLLLVGCSNFKEDFKTLAEEAQEEFESWKEEFESDKQEIAKVQETLRQAYSIGGFENASREYERFNSYASENGLGGTLIFIEGKVLNQTILGGEKKSPELALIIEQDDGNRWCVSVVSDSKIKEIENKEVRIFGTYLGFSDVMNLPGMGVTTDDTNLISKCRIEIKDGCTYKSVWNFWDDYIEKLEKQSEAEETKTQEESTKYVSTTEKNALKSAKNYLTLMPFSYSGLVKQLEYEKYSHEEAVYAVDNCGADWNEQASKKAKSYLDAMPFSKDRLKTQLEFEGFTNEQAEYGINSFSIDWNEQAAKKARSYLEIMAFSKDRLIEQLEFEGFTHEQAAYGAEQNGY